jgi:hypothetical protein
MIMMMQRLVVPGCRGRGDRGSCPVRAFIRPRIIVARAHFQRCRATRFSPSTDAPLPLVSTSLGLVFQGFSVPKVARADNPGRSPPPPPPLAFVLCTAAEIVDSANWPLPNLESC